MARVDKYDITGDKTASGRGIIKPRAHVAAPERQPRRRVLLSTKTFKWVKMPNGGWITIQRRRPRILISTQAFKWVKTSDGTRFQEPRNAIVDHKTVHGKSTEQGKPTEQQQSRRIYKAQDYDRQHVRTQRFTTR